MNLQGTRHGRIQRASAARVRYEKRRLPGRQAPEFRWRWLLRPGANTIAGGEASTVALKDSTEAEQFHPEQEGREAAVA